MTILVLLCIFIVSIFADQHCHFEYHSYHIGEDFRESRKNFTTELQQNCGEGTFTLKILLLKTWSSDEIENLHPILEVYLNKLLDHRPDMKTFINIQEINFDETEIDHETLTKVTVSGECMERVLNWEMRCQVNLIFIIDSFRTNDLMKFKKVMNEHEEEVVEGPEVLTLAPSPEITDWDNLYTADMTLQREMHQGQSELPVLVEEVKGDYTNKANNFED